MSSPNLRPGDRVRLLAGESKGIVGTIETVLSKDTVCVLLNRGRLQYHATEDVLFIRRGKAPKLSDALLGEEGK